MTRGKVIGPVRRKKSKVVKVIVTPSKKSTGKGCTSYRPTSKKSHVKKIQVTRRPDLVTIIEDFEKDYLRGLASHKGQ